MSMYKNLVFFSALTILSCGIMSCNHNKIACPTYKESFPESKKKTTPRVAGLPDDSAPVHRHKKSKSVMPGDGHGTKTRVPN